MSSRDGLLGLSQRPFLPGAERSPPDYVYAFWLPGGPDLPRMPAMRTE